MPYNYEKEKEFVFTKAGIVKILEIYTTARAEIAKNGSVKMENILGLGDSWQNMACVDFLCEISCLKERKSLENRYTPAQFRTFT